MPNFARCFKCKYLLIVVLALFSSHSAFAAMKSVKGLRGIATDKPFNATGFLLKNNETYSLKTGVLTYTLRGGPTFIYNKHLMNQANKKKQVTLMLKPSFIARTYASTPSAEMR